MLSHAEKNIYIDSAKLSYAKLKYRENPKGLHLTMLKLLVPQSILRLDGISPTDRRGCVGIPKIINRVISCELDTNYPTYNSSIVSKKKGIFLVFCSICHCKSQEEWR